MPYQHATVQHFFEQEIDRSYESRIARLRALQRVLQNREAAIYQALNTDLRKSREECWVTETGMVLSEIRTAIRHLRSWMRPQRKSTNLLNLPSGSRVVAEPLGTVLIIAPWNYPVQLALNPLVAALAAGNKVLLKPSEHAPASEKIILEILKEAFQPEVVLGIEGPGHEVIPPLLQEFRFDHIFYTGSTEVGRIIYQLAAPKLVPVTLELGGKSPCVVEPDANLQVAARRIVIARFSNAGQMCVAPDYLLVHESVRDQLVDEIKATIQRFFGNDPQQHADYGRIINRRQFDRICHYLREGTVVCGGVTDSDDLYIAPTLLADIHEGAAVLKEEIFGPVLPVLTWKNREEARQIIARNPNPLAFYVFTESASAEQYWLQQVPFGGGCVNNCAWHLTNHHLPFGGRGESGTGAYHGRYGFERFSHLKAVMKTPAWFDPSIKYPPFAGKLRLFKWVIR